ncbi:MAG TPA: hypothetical protein VF796_23185, partial [Humisphaera sp.]
MGLRRSGCVMGRNNFAMGGRSHGRTCGLNAAGGDVGGSSRAPARQTRRASWRKAALAAVRSLAAVALCQFTPASQAGMLYWDGSDTTPNADGGAGTWDLGTTANWDTAAIGGTDSVWTNINLDTAVFGGTASTAASPVALGAGITVGGLSFNTTGYVVSTGANTLTFGAADNTVLLNNVAAATITGSVGGTSKNVTLSTSNPNTAGTLTLNGTSANGWSGTTTVNAGATLALAGSNQALLGTSGIALNGGGITLTNTSAAEALLDRVNGTAGIAVNGGTITVTNTSGTTTYAETLGRVTLASGQLNLVLTNNQAGTGSQTLTLSNGGSGTGLNRTGGTSTATFSSGTGLSATKNVIVVEGAAATAANQIIGPWATVGTTAAAQTDYAVFDAASRVLAANIAGSAESAWTDAATAYTNSSAAVALSGNRVASGLRNTGATATITLSDGASGFTLATNGILNGVGTLMTVAPGAVPGSVTTPGTSGGTLFVNAGSGAITISAPINNNGGAVTLVKNGASLVLLNATTSTYSGGTVINAGQLRVASDAALGSAGAGITLNGGVLL